MGLRQRNKRRMLLEITTKQLSKISDFANGTRIEKIETLNLCGYNISRKTDSKRVDRIMENVKVEIINNANGILERERIQKRERNRRKRSRKLSRRR